MIKIAMLKIPNITLVKWNRISGEGVATKKERR